VAGVEPAESRIRDAILTAVRDRGAGRTVCPSEVARSLAEDWRPLMPRVRDIAAVLAEEGRIAVTQKGEPFDARSAAGPIRLGLP
jgi:hypothetical protein